MDINALTEDDLKQLAERLIPHLFPWKPEAERSSVLPAPAFHPPSIVNC